VPKLPHFQRLRDAFARDDAGSESDAAEPRPPKPPVDRPGPSPTGMTPPPPGRGMKRSQDNSVAQLESLVGAGPAHAFLDQVVAGLREHGRVELLADGAVAHLLTMLDREELAERLLVLALELPGSTAKELTGRVRAGPFANVSSRDVNQILFRRTDLFVQMAPQLDGKGRWEGIEPDPSDRDSDPALERDESESDFREDDVPPGGEGDAQESVTRRHRDRAFLAEKLTRLDEPHVQPLTLLCRQQERQWGREVPFVDPESGGTSAKVLVLLESPGPRASSARGSGLISFDNDDLTAANGLECLLEAGLPRHLTINWNIVPWYLRAVRKPTDAELAEAVPALEQFLRLLPRLQVVVLLGKTAQEGWLSTGLDRPGLTVLHGPHPSPQNFNTRPESRPALVEVFRRAAGLIGE